MVYKTVEWFTGEVIYK